MTTHELKTWPRYFDALNEGQKTFEVRLDDRGYQVGDTLVLREWNAGEYTGRQVTRTVTYVLRPADHLGIRDGYVVAGLAFPRIVATTPLDDMPWYADHANLVTLTRYMADTGASAGDIAYAVEKPWAHEDEWRDALAAAKAEAAS